MMSEMLNRKNRLTIADQDGFQPIYLTQGDEVIMSPRFSPNQPDEVTYVALGKDYSRIYLFSRPGPYRSRRPG